MGQYRQWLHSREVDQRLKARLEILEQELDQLHKQADLLAKTTSCTDNKIIQTLARQQTVEVLLTDAQHILSEHTTPVSQPIEESITGVSPALFAWSNLPNFDSQGVPTPNSQTNISTPLRATPHLEMNLLPKDMGAFVDEHTQAVPQVKLPWWLRKTVLTTVSPNHYPIDQQSLQTNYDVQRWLERWGRHPKDPQVSREDHVNEQHTK